MTVTREGEFVMSEHATVEQDKLVARNSKESEPVKMPECCNLELHVVCCVCRKPRQNPSLRSSKRNFCHCPDKVTVTDKDSNLIADCHFHFQRVVSASLKERAGEPDISFFQELDKCRVEEGIKVSLLVCKTQVGVIKCSAKSSAPS
jgi:hypothetical protein